MRSPLFFFKLFLIDFLLLKNRIKIKEIETEGEKSKAIDLIWNVYKQDGYIDLRFFPDSSCFKDEFDQNSVYFLAFFKNKIIGAVRLVLFSSLGFPSERFFNFISLPINNKNKIAEISRLVVMGEENKYKKNIVTFGLLKKCFYYSKNKGIEFWYAILPEKLKIYFEKFKIKFYELSTNIPTSDQLEARKPHPYFQTYKPKLYKVILQEIEENFTL